MRTSEIKRKTMETDIELFLDIDGKGEYKIATGCGFFDHMLELFAKHGNFDLKLSCKGDTHVDMHHTVEDAGIVLGKAFKQALGDKRGITRYGDIILPMDETLIACTAELVSGNLPKSESVTLCATDVSGRAHLGYDVKFRAAAVKVGDMDVELVEEFFLAFVRNAELTLHIKQLSGKNAHHIVEGIFKAFARARSKACAIDPRSADSLPSTKGTL